MNKKKLIELRCKAWGITEDEYYCNQNSDFSLEDMARAYRRGKNKGFEKGKELEAQIEKMKNCKNCANYMISGKCPSFFRTGWCKNWEMTKE
jgi:rRNA maturation protein Nop10